MSRMKVIIICIVVLLLAAGIGVYNSLSSQRTDVENGIAVREPEESGSQQTDQTRPETGTALQPESSGQVISPVQTKEPVRNEEIPVVNNSPEYDLKASLVEDSGKQTFIKLEYYFEGVGTVNTLDSKTIPEIEGIFGKREENASATGAYAIKNAYLNPKLAKVYFIINGDGSHDMFDTSLYAVKLSDASVKKVFSGIGKYSDMKFSKDLKYLGYSYNDPPQSSVLQEAALLEILDCDTDELIVKNSRHTDGKKIGTNIKPEGVYNYTFISWYSNNTVKLKQEPVTDKKDTGREVLYDISRDLILNKDGSVVNTEKTEAESGASVKPPAESAAVKVLKDFYAYLALEKDYSKAMELLDEKFMLKLEMLKQFGAEELYKSDISAESASAYSELLRAAKLDSIVKEEAQEGITVIYYYQTMDLSTDTQIRQPMSAQIKQSGKAWKIIILQDADGGKEPFAK